LDVHGANSSPTGCSVRVYDRAMRCLVGVAVVMLALVPACGDDNGNQGAFVGLDKFDSSYKDAECMYLVRCGLFADQTTCLAATLQTNSLFTISAQTRVEILA